MSGEGRGGRQTEGEDGRQRGRERKRVSHINAFHGVFLSSVFFY